MKPDDKLYISKFESLYAKPFEEALKKDRLYDYCITNVVLSFLSVSISSLRDGYTLEKFEELIDAYGYDKVVWVIAAKIQCNSGNIPYTLGICEPLYDWAQSILHNFPTAELNSYGRISNNEGKMLPRLIEDLNQILINRMRKAADKAKEEEDDE